MAKNKKRKPSPKMSCTFCGKPVDARGLQAHIRLVHPDKMGAKKRIQEKLRKFTWILLSETKKELDSAERSKLLELEKEFGIFDGKSQVST